MQIGIRGINPEFRENDTYFVLFFMICLSMNSRQALTIAEETLGAIQMGCYEGGKKQVELG